MKKLAILLLSPLLAACAAVPVMERSDQLFQDVLFAAPSEHISAADVFSLSDAMKNYLHVEIAEQLRTKGPQQGLIDALYSKNQLKVDYDSAQTRNAAQTFADRAGNCLSLVIMTSAFAKELGLPVRYQSVFVDESWSRAGGLYFSAGHVNLTVGKRYHDFKTRVDDNVMITIDFNPPQENRSHHTWAITEATVLAMYMNNRGAEALARGQLDNAYWWAREAILQEPTFPSAYNTLGVIYRRHGNLVEAENVFRRALVREPLNLQAMSNLAMVLNDQGRFAESTAITVQLESRQPYPPFYFFNLGQTAMQAGDFKAARDMFAKEVDRDAYNHEFHFWLASAYYRLGDVNQTRKHLAIAMDYSPTRKHHDLYAAKLDRMRAYQ
ncbi:MAG: tetratricopeptide repeat protein [Betaproteobacteria bacterium]